MDLLYVVAGWVAVSIVVSLLMGRFIAAGKGALPSRAVSEAGEFLEVKTEPRNAAPNTGQDHTKQLAA